ncbi:MAG: peptide ABC transporter substrate-binding protein, partial [Chloroflexaceae bacterium]|nr:peptide ABC transporter substrate-binding protein [Chloroflexaceae bacterium]
DTIIVGSWQEPGSFLDYANSQAIRVETELLYRPRWVTFRDFSQQPNPALVEGDLPSLENGGATLTEVTVQPGEPVFDLESKTVVEATTATTARQLVVTGKIKAGLKWDDGQPLTARDFVFAWKLSCDAESGSLTQDNCPLGSSPSAGGIVSNYEAVDDTTLRLTYAPGVVDSLFFSTVFGPNGTPQPEHLFKDVKPADVLKDERATGGTSALPLGYGPYKMTKWNKGESITFEANPNWSGEAPKTPTMIYKFFADAVALASAVIAGEIDVSGGQTGVDIDQYPYLTSVAKNGDINFQLNVDSNRFESLRLNLNDPNDAELKAPHPFLSDVRVRKAIAMGLNRQQMVDTIFYGQSKVLDQPQLPQHESFNAAMGKVEYNPEEAKKLLDEAGWTPGADGIREKDGKRASFTLVTTSGVPLRQRATQIAQSNLKELGIEVNLSYIPPAVLISPDVYFSRRFDVIQIANTFSPLNPDGWWYGITACDEIPTPANNFAGQNYAGWCDEEASNAATEANYGTLDPQERRAAWDIVLQRYFETGYHIIPLFMRPSMVASVPGLQGATINPTEFLTWNVETWTLEDQG